MKVYGPYTRKDGRKHVIVIDGDKRRTISYSKFLLEDKLGRPLNDNETCDHKDGDFTNDNLDNLQPLSRKENAAKAFIDCPHKRAKMVQFCCPYCGAQAEKLKSIVDHNRRLGRAGPYCSRQCAGKASHKGDSYEG